MSKSSGKSRGWAAIAFSQGAITVATARPTAGDFHVASQTSEPMIATEDGQNALSTTVQALQKRADLREHRIVTAIGCEDVMCQTLRFPTTDPAELKQMLDLQADNLSPFPVEEAVYSYEAIETLENETRVLVSVAPKAVINERVSALENVDWRAELVSVDVVAIFRELLQRGALPGDALLHHFVLVHAAAAHLVAFTAGKVIGVRSVMLGAEGCRDPEARLALANEVQRTRLAADLEFAGLQPGKVILAPADEALRDAVVVLASTWDGAVEVLEAGAVPDVATALCLDAARRANLPGLNLLPQQWQLQRRKARVRQTIIRSAIALAVIYLVALVGFISVLGVRKAQLNSVRTEMRKLKPQFEAARELNRTVIAMQKQMDRRYSVLEVLREASQMMPDNVKLNGFLFKKDDTVVLRAQAQNSGFATDFISRLERSEMFAKITPGQQRIEPGTGLTKFDVTCTLKSAAGSYGAN